MLYAIVGEDIPNSLQKRTAARPAHLKRVDELIAAGKLIIGGAFLYSIATRVPIPSARRAGCVASTWATAPARDQARLVTQ